MACTPASASASSRRGPPPTTPVPGPSSRSSPSASRDATEDQQDCDGPSDNDADSDGSTDLSATTASFTDLQPVKIKFIATLKKYVGDRSATPLPDSYCESPNPEAVAQFAWNTYNRHIKALAAKDDEGNWTLDETKPNRDWDNNIDDYIHVYLGNHKHVFAREASRGTETFTVTKWKGWAKKDEIILELSIHMYGTSLKSKADFEAFHAQIAGGLTATTRGGAPTTSVINDIACRLKEAHSDYLFAHDIIWKVWAVWVMEEHDALDVNEAIQQPPPLEILQLTQPIKEPTRSIIEALRHVSSLSRDTIEGICSPLNHIRDEFARVRNAQEALCRATNELAHRFEALELVLATESRIQDHWENVIDNLEGFAGWRAVVRRQEDIDHRDLCRRR
ncbi:hypothetical protein BCR44DRAFT_1504777 [Catenaria anguillulae PL171]|uniref:Uncharacterized protein n=1 Tax=Catenaria anguillulae PL171 TaxID=765915 RepID=A0A1Y2H5Q5_9FUNG|nr:hypothetical protein BCR44DRAFT_1504777 [Catenaria anguillulae PL171]